MKYILATKRIPIVASLVGAVAMISLWLLGNWNMKKGETLLIKGEVTRSLNYYKKALFFWPFYRLDNNFKNDIGTAQHLVNAVREGPAVTVFFELGTSQTEIQSLINDINSLEGTQEVRYISSEDAYRRYLTLNKDDPQLTDSVSPKFLPASIEVYLKNLSASDKIVQYAKSKLFVDDVVTPNYR